MRKILILIGVILLAQNIQSQSVVYNWNGTVFGANGEQARRMTIGRVYYNQFHWGTYGNMKITIRSSYFKSGYVEYLLQANPATTGNIPVLSCLSAGGYNASLVRLELGEQTNAGAEYYGGVNYYRDIYLDAGYYSVWYAEAVVTGPFAYDRFSINDNEYSLMSLFSSPSISNISSFVPHRKLITIPATNADFQLDGRVGIGTANPQAPLQVNAAEGGAIRLQYAGNSGYGQIETNAGNDLILRTSGGAGIHERMMIAQSSGNVGIGTSSPSEKLSVNGNIRTKKLIVSQSGWPDYVFDSSYSLRSLSEVEKFIAKNKHLPDMPSASEVEENGISVGDNQALLLKKIEEITIYLIQLKKENELQQREIKLLKRKVKK